MEMPTREAAVAVWQKYNSDPHLWIHALTVEGVMRHFARLAGEDEDAWGVVGLLHDVDYERWPDEHCKKAQELLRDEGMPDWLIRAVASHGWGLCCDIEPETRLEKTLFTIDELTGLVTAAALMRPSKSVTDMELKSVKKKYKSPSFAAGVNRGVIEQGAGMLGMELDSVIGETILGMREIHETIGL